MNRWKFQDLPEPIQRLLEEIAVEVTRANVDIADHNYGLAQQRLIDVNQKLPQWNGEYAYHWVAGEMKMMESRD